MERQGGLLHRVARREGGDLEHQALAKLQKMGVKVVSKVDKSGFASISTPIQDKLAKDLGPNAVKVLALVREVK